MTPETKIETMSVAETEPHPQDEFVQFLTHVENGPLVETKLGLRYFDVLCLAVQDDAGNCLLVRKDNSIDNTDPSDWFVEGYNPDTGKCSEEKVLSVKIQNAENGYVIEMELAPHVDYLGFSHLIFGLSAMYNNNGSPSTISHKKYYGRGSGSIREEQIDYVYTQEINASSGVSIDSVS